MTLFGTSCFPSPSTSLAPGERTDPISPINLPPSLPLSADQRLLEESTVTICKNFAINNCQTGNFGSLVRVFLTRATELKSSNELEDNIFTWQTYNALFIIRNICKYFVENLSDEMLLQQFEMTSPKAEGDLHQ